MKESKAVYVRKRDLDPELNLEYHFHTTKILSDGEYSPVHSRNEQKIQDVGCQYDCKRDSICTCRYLAPPRRKQEDRYFGASKLIYSYQRSRSFTDIGVGSVKALQRKKVKRIYLPETVDRAVGSSDLSTYVLQRTRQQWPSGYYENKRTSSKCVGGILEYNIGCAINEKLSPIVQTISGSTSYCETAFNKNIEIGTSAVVKDLTNTTTQVESSCKKDTESVSEMKTVEIVQPVSINPEELKDMITTVVASRKAAKAKQKPTDKGSSSDSLLQHVHNLEIANPSNERNSRCSIEAEDLMENKLELEYRNIFATKSKSKDSKCSRTSDMKSTSTLKRRFEALRRGLVKKDDSKKNAVIIAKVSSQISTQSRKDVSINSDPPSLQGRSFSSTKPFSPFGTKYSRQNKTLYNPRVSHYRQSVTSYKKETDSADWSLKAADDDSETQGVKGMFKLWGKKFNLEEDNYKRRCTPKPSYRSNKGATKEVEEPKEQAKPIAKAEPEEKKEGRKFFFFKNKKKAKEKPYKAKKGVTTGRCEIRDGLVINILGGNVFDPIDVVPQPEVIKPEDYDSIARKAWLKKFLTRTIDSKNSVKVRWNNNTYAPSSSTVFEMMDNIYKDTSVVFRSKSQVTVQSSYKSYTRQHVNFMRQNIEAWMIPKTVTDRPKPVRQLKPQLICKLDEDRNNMEVRISDQKWFIDKSKAFSHKIEVVLHSKNFRKPNKKQSSEYLRIDIPKGFFLDSSCDEVNKRATNQSSDEEVFKIVEYETGSDSKKDKPTRNLNIDHKQNKIKVTVSVKESKQSVLKGLDSAPKQPTRDMMVQGSNVYVPKRCDVIGVGIITHRDLSQIRKPILKIQDDFSDEESEHNILRPHTKKCEFAESYLQEYYRHWTPLGIDLYSWCVSDSQLKCCSDHSRTSFHNQGDGTKSCPNIFEEFQTSAMVSSCGASSCSQCQYTQYRQDKSKIPEFSSKSKKCCSNKSNPDKRVLPKDSIEVFKRRKIYAMSAKSKWVSPNGDFSSSPSCESKGDLDSRSSPMEGPRGGGGSPQIGCPKIRKPCCKTVESRPSSSRRKRARAKHVSLPDCDTMNEYLAKQLNYKLPESILAVKGSSGGGGGAPGAKHAKVNPRASCEIPRSPCRDSCETMKKPPCSTSKQSCENPTTCTPTPQNFPSAESKPHPSCPPSPPSCLPNPRSPPTSSPSPLRCLPKPGSPPTSPPSPPRCLPKPRSPPSSPPSPPRCLPKPRSPPTSPPSPPGCLPKPRSPPRSPPRPPGPPCGPSHPSSPHIHIVSCPPKAPSPQAPSGPNSPQQPPPAPQSPPPSGSPETNPSSPCQQLPPCPKPPCPSAPVPPPPPPPCPPETAPRSPTPPPCPPKPKPYSAPPPCPPTTPPYPDTPPQTPCSKSNKPCPKAPPSCPASPELCCSDPNRCPSLLTSCQKVSSSWRTKFFPPKKASTQNSAASSPPKPVPCEQPFCRSLACQESKTSISFHMVKPDAPFYYSPIHPCPPKPEKQPLQCQTSPCTGMHNHDFPLPTQNQVSNQSSTTSLNNIDYYEQSRGIYKKDCQLMPKLSCETVPSVKNVDCKTSCPNYKGSPRLPCIAKIPGMQCPPPPRAPPPPPPPAEPCIRSCAPCPGAIKSRSRLAGLFLKMKPNRKPACSRDCLAWENDKMDDGCISLNSHEKITIRLKKDTPSTEEIREGLNIKVQDEDGCTLFERKDYRLQHAGCNSRPSLLGEMYKASEVRRVTTNDSAQAIGAEKGKPKEVITVASDPSIANLIEIQFKLKVTQGEKTTEIHIANDPEKDEGSKERNQPLNKSKQDVFVVKDDGEKTTDHSDPKNDINIRIVIKNFKSKSGKKKSVNLQNENYNDFSKKISAKFHTVSTGYSDIFHDENAFSVHRATVDLTTSVDDTITNNASMHSNKIVNNRSMHSRSVLTNQSVHTNKSLHIDKSLHMDMSVHDNKSLHMDKSLHTDKSVHMDKSLYTDRSVHTNKSSRIHNNKSEQIMSEPANDIRKAILRSSEHSACKCLTEDEKSEDTETKSFQSTKYITHRDIHDNADETTDTQLTDHKYEYNEDTDTEKPIKYDTEETDTDRQVDPPKYDTETDTEKQPGKKYDTFMSTTDTDEPDILPELKKSQSLGSFVKPHTMEEKKEMLKHVMAEAHDTKYKNKTRMRKLKDMLKVILTSDSSDHEDSKVKGSDLAKDVTYASLKPNYFRDTDSMNNYYKMESKTVLSEVTINRQVVYPSAENNSDCSNSTRSVEVLSSETESKRGGGCMCSTLAARLKLASRIGDGGGCCCGTKQMSKKSEEITCDLKRESDYTQIDYKTAEFVDVHTQNSRYLTSKINSTNLSVHSTIRPSIRGSFNFGDDVKAESGILNVDSRQLSLRRTPSPERCHLRECEMRKRNRNAIMSISDEEKIVLVSGQPTRFATGFNKVKDDKKGMARKNASDILQSYEAKKAVLEIYAEKTFSDKGEHLVAKLPKFVYGREQEIQANYEAMASNTYKTVCKKNIIMMAIKR